MSPRNGEAAAIHEALARWAPDLVRVLSADDIEEALNAPRTHKPHPVEYLARASASGDTHAAHVATNTGLAARAARADGTADAWIRERMAEAAREKDLANASSTLAEIRAFGTLLATDLSVCRLRVPSKPTPDFEIATDRASALVEVHAKQMNGEESTRLAEWSAKPRRENIHVVSPAGKPKEGETVAENVISKFAGIKPRARQASEEQASILWLDLQDEDWFPLDVSYAAPVVAFRGDFYCGGLWHAAYGLTGDPVFEHHSPEQRATEGVPLMRHAGLLHQYPQWSAVVLSLTRDVVLFENPRALVLLPDTIARRLSSVLRFNVAASRGRWPGGHDLLVHRLVVDRRSLWALAAHARYSW